MTDNVLKISGKEIELPAPVKQRVEINDLIVVRVYPSDQELDAFPQELLNRNVYAFDSSCKLLWQIQEAPHGGIGEDKAYMDISLESGKIIAGNWTGTDYFVDLSSGRVSQAKKDVRPW